MVLRVRETRSALRMAANKKRRLGHCYEWPRGAGALLQRQPDVRDDGPVAVDALRLGARVCFSMVLRVCLGDVF